MSLLPSLSDYVDADPATGLPVAGDDWLRTAVRDVLTTPLGSCVMRRDYGSRLFQLQDAPMTRGLVADIVAASAEALLTWLPLLKLKTVRVVDAVAGAFDLDLVFDLNGALVALPRALS